MTDKIGTEYSGQMDRVCFAPEMKKRMVQALTAETPLPDAKRTKRHAIHRVVLAAVAAVLVLALTAGVVGAASGGRLGLQAWFMKKPTSVDGLLGALSAANGGLIYEDKDVRVEALGALRSGSMARLAILTTVKKEPAEQAEGFAFFTVRGISPNLPQLEDGSYEGLSHCIVREWPGTDGRVSSYLKENQILDVVALGSASLTFPDTITLTVGDIVSVTEAQPNPYKAQPLITGGWNWTVVFDDKDGIAVLRTESDEVFEGGGWMIEDSASAVSMELSPFAIELRFSRTDAAAIQPAFDENTAELHVLLKDGSEVFPGSITAYTGTVLCAEFPTPIDPEQVRSVSFNGLTLYETGAD